MLSVNLQFKIKAGVRGSVHLLSTRLPWLLVTVVLMNINNPLHTLGGGGAARMSLLFSLGVCHNTNLKLHKLYILKISRKMSNVYFRYGSKKKTFYIFLDIFKMVQDMPKCCENFLRKHIPPLL